MLNHNSIVLSSANDKASIENYSEINQEWELADLIQLITTEIEQVQDALLVKSHNRRLMMAVNELNLDLQVNVRYDAQGKLLFRTVPQGQSGMSSLKLDFGHLLDTQVQEIHKSKDFTEGYYELERLPGIERSEIQTLKLFSIHSVADLEQSTQTPVMLAELSQKTGIDEARIRSWRQLPYISTIQPEQGPPKSIVVITGDNFTKGQVRVLFQDQPVLIHEAHSTETRLIVEIPKDAIGSGALVVEVNGQRTNAKTWTVELCDLAVQDILVTPSRFPESRSVTFQAKVANVGAVDTEAYQMQWELITPNGSPQGLPITISCPPVAAGQSTLTHPIHFDCKQSGRYMVICTADPGGKLADRSRTNQIFTKSFNVSSSTHIPFW